jgi:predicted dehydrogenase
MMHSVTQAHVGLVGCGRWGSLLLRDLRALGARVSVVARSDASRIRAQTGNADEIVGRIVELQGVDGVYVATQIATHAEVVAAALGLGVPVFCEKPLADDPDRAEALAALAPDRVFVLDKWRYHPGILELARVARSGMLGPVIGLSTRRLGWGNRHPDSSALWVLAPHDLAIGLEILGRIPPLGSVVLDAIDGRLYGFTALLSCDHAWQAIEVSERSPDRIREVRLFCTRGVAALTDPFADHITIHRGDATDPEPPLTPERVAVSTRLPLEIMLAETLQFLGGGPPPRTSAADGARAVRRLAEIAAGARTQ